MAKGYKTNVEGIWFYRGKPLRGGNPNEPELSYYCRLWDENKVDYRHETLGKKFADGMTPESAGRKRDSILDGHIEPNYLALDRKRAEKEKIKEQQVHQERHTLDGMREKYNNARDKNGVLYGEKSAYWSDLYNYQNHIVPVLGEKSPQDYTVADIDRLRQSVFNKGLAPATVGNCLGYLRRILIFNGIRLKIDLPKYNNEVTEDLTPEQQKTLVTVLKANQIIHPVTKRVVQINRPVADMMLLIMCTGMRQGEVRKLKWEHIKFERKTYVIKDPKGGKDVHNPLSDDAIEIILRQKVPPPPIPLMHSWRTEKMVDSEYVFPGKNGGMRFNISEQARKLCDLAGIPKDFRPCHGLRHWYLTELADSGVDIKVVSQLAGHKSLAMTMRYVNVRDKAKQDAVNSISLNNIMNGGDRA